ncbi:MAG: MFS transporter [Oscillospiraceae bacterium]|jgi:MFS family permease|nr:MFS transporter [Oscillospiraceae bacterium]
MNKPRLWTRDFTVLTAANMLYTFGFYALMPTVPMLVRSLGQERLVGSVALSFTCAAIVMRFLSPYLLQRTGKKRMMCLGAGLSCVFTALCARAASIEAVFVFRVLQGFGFGMVSTVAATLAADLLPDSRRGEGIGYFAMGTTVMVALSQAVGQKIEELFGIPSVFFAAAAGELLSFAGLAVFFKPPERVLYPKDAKKLSLAKSFFVPVLLLQCGLLIFFGFSRSAEQNFLRLFASDMGISTVFYFTFQTVVSFFAKYAAGILFDKKGHLWCILPGGVSLMLAFVTMSAARTLPILLVAGFFSGVGMGALLPAMQSWTITSVRPEERGVASAAYYNYYDIGQSIGAPVLGAAAAVGVTQGARNYGRSFILAALSMALFLIIYLAAFIKRRRAASK